MEQIQAKKEQEKGSEYITKDMLIGDVLAKYPSLAEVLLKYGLHCVGCHANYYDTIEQGMKVHGLPDEAVDQAVKECNGAIAELTSPQSMNSVTLTKKAVEKLKELMNEQNNVKQNESSSKKGKQAGKYKGLRVGVIEGGCSGQTYDMELEENLLEKGSSKNKKDDYVFEQDGIKVFIDKQSFEFIKGSRIDYLDTLQGAGFKISNPNAKSNCGCGQSFS